MNLTNDFNMIFFKDVFPTCPLLAIDLQKNVKCKTTGVPKIFFIPLCFLYFPCSLHDKQTKLPVLLARNSKCFFSLSSLSDILLM